MKTRRIVLASLTLVVAIGGAFAFKASRAIANVYTYDGTTYNKVFCHTAGIGYCPDALNQRLYTYSATQGFVTIARSAAHPVANL